MSGSEVLLLIMLIVFMAVGWLPRNASRSRRLDYTIIAGWFLGVWAILRVYGEENGEPFLIFSMFAALVWFGSILWLPRNSQIPTHRLSPLKGLLIGLSTAALPFIIGFLDRDHRWGWFGFTVYFGLRALHEFLVRLRTESKTVSPFVH